MLNMSSIANNAKHNLAASKKTKRSINYFSFIVLVILAILFILPIYWMLIGSLKPYSMIMKMPPDFILLNPTISNYIRLFKKTQALRWFFNSVIVASSITFLVVMVSSAAGYAYAKKSFRGKHVLFWVLMATMMIPKQVLLVPLFIMVNKMKLFDTYLGLILPLVGWPIGTFLMKQFMVTIPSELLEAAKIDGCPELKIFSRIVLPLAKPGVATLAIFTFMQSWNDYMWQLVMIKTSVIKTLPVGIAGLQEEFSAQYGLLMAGACLAACPMIAVFLCFQKYFIKGITLGSVKG
jgi:multiple sugar transport system permease protein